MMKHCFRDACIITVIITLWVVVAKGQITGYVLDSMTGEPIPFASIHVENSSIGTSTNENGYYNLTLTKGKYRLVVQSIGYESTAREVEDGALSQELNWNLSPQIYELSGVVVSAQAEDPAYAIIRKAIAKRAHFSALNRDFRCESYVRGVTRAKYIPEKILGSEVGDLDGALDSARQGIIYLSESISTLYVDDDRAYKEIVHSSLLSGNDQGYSFNSGAELHMDTYANYWRLGDMRSIINPIARNALQYYDYRLEGAFYDNEGALINKISVTPKNKNSPTVFGDIYIVEDSWAFHSFDLSMTKAAMRIPILDTLSWQATFISIPGIGYRPLFQSKVQFDIQVLGIKMDGEFIGVFTDYERPLELDKGFFDHQEYVVKEESNQKNTLFWDTMRPIPLTTQLIEDYHRKDSISTVRNSKPYLDSIDRVENAFHWSDLWTNYSAQNSTRHNYWQIHSPLSKIHFNTVQGWNATLSASHYNYLDDKETKRLLFWAELNYGFSERVWRPKFTAAYRPNRLSRAQYGFSVGSDIRQLNNSPVSPFLNDVYSLLLERNYPKYYGTRFLRLFAKTEPIPGSVLSAQIQMENRQSLVNHSDYKIFNSENRAYTPNIDLSSTNGYEALTASIIWRHNFGQKYMVYPHRRYALEATYPEWVVGSRLGLGQLWGERQFTHLYSNLLHKFRIEEKGESQLKIGGGLFWNHREINELDLVDFQHFNTTELAVSDGLDFGQFMLLPYFAFSTNDHYWFAHYRHNFKGAILERIPLLKKTKSSLLIGYSHLQAKAHGIHHEVYLGVETPLFLDMYSVWSWGELGANWGLRVGINLNAI